MNARPLPLVFASAAIVLSLSTVVSNRALDDWPQWRGPNRDGISTERGLLKAWPKGGPPLAWKSAGAGQGYSSFSVADGAMYTMGARGGTEYVMAFSAADGRKYWETPIGRQFSNDQGDGPRGTPTVDGNRLFVSGASGDVAALDRATGKPIWSINVLKQFGGSNIRWGFSESPLVLPDRIVINAGAPGASIVALNKATGAVLWKTLNDQAGYSSGLLHEIGGVRQAIFFTATRVVGVDVTDGRLLWSYDKVANNVANIATPVARGNKVFLSSGYNTGGALLELTPSGRNVTAREVYFTTRMQNHHASAVLIGDHLYGFHASVTLNAMKFDTGEVAWSDRSVGKGAVVYADERLYLLGENGVVGLAEANPTGYREHGRFELVTGAAKTWSHPVVSGGKLFLRDQDTVYAYDVRAR